MLRRLNAKLLLGVSLIVIASVEAQGQDLVNPSGSTVGTGFIRVGAGETFDNVLNLGTIAGLGGAGPGIEVAGGGTVVGDVRNASDGTIDISGASGVGIRVEGSVGDDVENLGLIRVDTSGEAFGIRVGPTATVDGDVANRADGTILVGARATQSATAYGIAVGGTIDGLDDVSNLGVLRVEAQASWTVHESGLGNVSAGVPDANRNARAVGIEVDLDTDAGTLSNEGAIDVAATALTLFSLDAESGVGGEPAQAFLEALSGPITMMAAATAGGIRLTTGATDAPALRNDGTVDVAAAASMAFTLAARAPEGSALAYLFAADAIHLGATATASGLEMKGSTVAGLVNSGALTVGAGARVALDLAAEGTAGAEAYVSTTEAFSVTASAAAAGIHVRVPDAPDVAFENDGVLDVAAAAGVDLKLAADAAAGDARAYLSATGEVAVRGSANAAGMSLEADGLAVGAVTNTGAMTVTAANVLTVDISARIDDPAAVASAFVSSYDSVLGGDDVRLAASAFANGILVNAGTEAGGAVGPSDNSGALDVAATAALDMTLTAYAEAGDAVAYIDAELFLVLGATANANGIALIAPTVGAISNAGDINVLARADVDALLSATAATGNAQAYIEARGGFVISATAIAHGIVAQFETLDGGMENSGDVTATAIAGFDLRLRADDTFIDERPGRPHRVLAEAAGLEVGSEAGATIEGDVRNDGDVRAYAFASAYLSGLDSSVYIPVSAAGAAMIVGYSATVHGDVVNSGLLEGVARVSVGGTAFEVADAFGVGLLLAADVTGDVVNAGVIIAVASGTSAYARGIELRGHAVSGSIRNTGTIAAFADGDPGKEFAYAIDASEAGGGTLIEQLDGLMIGDIRLAQTDMPYADRLAFSGGRIFGDILGDGYEGGSDTLLAYQGADRTLNLSGDISGLAAINVNPTDATSATAPVELRLGGDVTNTGALDVNPHGTLVVGLDSAIGVASYDQDPDGTTLFEVAPGELSGHIAPSGGSLAGAVGIRPQAGLYGDEESFLVIDGGAITGTYDTVLSTLLLDVDDRYVGDDVYLDVSRIAFDAVGGLTRNESSVAGAIEADYGDIVPGTDFSDVVGSLFGLTADEYRDALGDLAGAEHAQMLKAGAGAIQSIDEALLGRLAFLRGLDGPQMASVDEVGAAFAQVASTGDVDLRMDLAQAGEAAAAEPGQSGGWARVFGGRSTLDGDENAAGFDTTGGGVALGVDRRLSPDLMLGLYGGYAHTEADFDTSADGTIDTYQLGAYGAWTSGALRVDGLISGAWQDYDVSRAIGFLGRHASSDYTGWALGASAEVGYAVPLGAGAVLEPTAGLDYIHLATDGFSEDGADSVGLEAEEGAYDSLKSSLGVRLTAEIEAGGGMLLVPTVSIAWQHEFLDAEGEVTARFAGSPGASFDVVGSANEADAALVSLGVALTSGSVTAFVGYDGTVAGDATSHQGTVGLRLGF